MVKKFFGLSEKMNNDYLTDITGQTENDVKECLTALINNDLKFICTPLVLFINQTTLSIIYTENIYMFNINKIKTNNTLSFFTPALQIQNNFAKTDHQQRNVLHYLFSNNQIKKNNTQPPFNYIRSMMLFGSNKGLTDGLCQREKKSLTPIEVYLFTHKNLAPLVNHELTALFALIEIEDNQQSIEQANYLDCIEAVSILCKEQAQAVNQELQRIILIATYYKIAIKKVVTDITNIS